MRLISEAGSAGDLGIRQVGLADLLDLPGPVTRTKRSSQKEGLSIAAPESGPSFLSGGTIA